MLEVADAPTLRAELARVRCEGKRVALVPTMGYLHDGHARLMLRARAECDVVVVSVFVNPTQFGPSEDFDRYPRDLNRDRAIARAAGVDLLFVPDGHTMYPDGIDRQQVWVEPGLLASHLDGASRPTHFRGVATVVSKLFNLTLPHRAYFGQKDGQQALIIERMVRDLAFDTTIVIVPTVRDVDGLALSSRNVFLSAEERAQAVVIPHALAAARAALGEGVRDSGTITQHMTTVIRDGAPLARIDFVEVVDAITLQPIDRIEWDAMIALAVFFGSTRLIDNLVVRFAHGAPHFT